MTITRLTHYDNDAAYADVLVGRKIVGAHWGQLVLDDGTVLQIDPNQGCGGCAAGNYWVDLVATHDNVITNVDLVEGEGSVAGDERYSLFVYTDRVGTEVMTVEGTEGNGYYGSGFEIKVRRPNFQ